MAWSILIACGLLLAGFACRARLRFLQALFIPASVIGGLLGLGIVQTLHVLPGDVGVPIEHVDAITNDLRGWPGPLIAVVFACLLLERPGRSLGAAMRGAAQQGIMVWIIVLGETLVGLTATWLIISRTHDVPRAFGQLIETGFAGGHGTAGAMGVIFDEALDFPAGLDLGMVMATVGLVGGVITGIAFVNIAIRRGWTRASAGALQLVSGMEGRNAPRPIAYGRVRSEVIDPLVFQLLLVAAAFAIGTGLHRAFIAAATSLPLGESRRYVENVPLFMFTLLGGLGLRHLMTLLRIDDLIDGESVRRILAVAMEFLIVAAITSLAIEVVAAYIGPLMLLAALGFAWAAFCLLYLSRRLLPGDDWFELAILNYGMSTGTTAQGMMLLRIVDPELESDAAEDYALAAPLSAPFVGGGVITLTMPLLLARFGYFGVIAGLGAGLIALYAIGRLLQTGSPRRDVP